MRKPEHPGLRPFQSELEKTMYERLMSGAPITVAWVAAGGGKTKGYFNAAQRLYAEGKISAMVVLSPRLLLREQAEDDWDEWRPLYIDPVMGKVLAQRNEVPLTRADEFGYISTYSALVANPGMHLDWARQHAGRFLLVCDEGHFLGIGIDGNDEGGTEAGKKIEQIAAYAAHTLITTGTTDRSDGSPLVLANYSEPDYRGRRYLEYHLKSTYSDGIELRYLRPGQFNLTDGNVTFSNQEMENISALERRLHKVLREPAVWKDLCHKIVKQLNDCRLSWSRYRALLSCLDQSHARDVYNYLTQQYPTLKIRLAISDEGREAQTVLKRFKPKEKLGGEDDGDILVTVGMVSLGYDAPTICVVGNLSSRRWDGWLRQLFARGARVWEKGGPPIDEQECYYISTNDPKNHRFAEQMRLEIEAGIRQRLAGPTPMPPSGPDISVVDVEMTDEEVLGLSAEQDLSPAELAGLRRIKLDHGRYMPETVMAEIIRKAGHSVPTVEPVIRNGKSSSAKRDDMRTLMSKRLSYYVYMAYNLQSGSEEFGKRMSQLNGRLNKMQNVKAVTFCTEEQRYERIRIIDGWIASGAPQ